MKYLIALSVIFCFLSLNGMLNEKSLYRFDNIVDAELDLTSKAEHAQAKKELLAMEQEDQDFRRAALSEGRLFNCQEAAELSKKHVEKLREIIQQFGWPTEHNFGKEYAHAAWLIAQHANHDIQFQKESLAIIADLTLKDTPAPHDQVANIHFAYLFDRILVNEKKEQCFGTQYDKNGKLLPIKNSDQVDERRNKIGLMPLKDYEKLMIRNFKRIFTSE